MIRPKDFYIDLGTANTLIYAQSRGLVLNEPSVLTLRHVHEYREDLVALGQRAKTMLGKNPQNLSVLRPLREGVIADFESTARMLHAFIARVKESVFWLKPRLIISLPCETTEFEKRAVKEVGLNLGARQVHLLDEPVAAAIGSGLPVLEHRGQMIVDIGGGTTEIAVISLGGIVTARAVRIGGDNIDRAVMDHLHNQHRFLIGEQTAEALKHHVASADLSAQRPTLEIGGLNLRRMLPTKLAVTSAMIAPAVDTVVKQIIAAVKKTLEDCPPEISGDILTDGIVLAGGGALLHGFAKRIAQETGVPTRVCNDPLLSVARGGARALEDSKLFDLLERPA